MRTKRQSKIIDCKNNNCASTCDVLPAWLWVLLVSGLRVPVVRVVTSPCKRVRAQRRDWPCRPDRASCQPGFRPNSPPLRPQRPVSFSSKQAPTSIVTSIRTLYIFSQPFTMTTNFVYLITGANKGKPECVACSASGRSRNTSFRGSLLGPPESQPLTKPHLPHPHLNSPVDSSSSILSKPFSWLWIPSYRGPMPKTPHR